MSLRWTRFLVGCVVFAVPPVLVSAGARAGADRLGRSVALELESWVSPLTSQSEHSEAVANSVDPSETLLSETPSAVGTRLTGRQRAHGAAPSRARSALHGVRISASQVLSLAARRAMPRAVPVNASAEHPAGLLLRGVSALGVGLQDGDVLTEAAGQKASSVAVVIGLVLSARSRQVPEISGRFYRAGVPFALTVEQPYPKQPVPG